MHSFFFFWFSFFPSFWGGLKIHQKLVLHKQWGNKNISQKGLYLLLFDITKLVSTKQLKVDSKDWNTGALKVHKCNLFFPFRKTRLPNWPITKKPHSYCNMKLRGKNTWGLLGSDWEIQVKNSSQLSLKKTLNRHHLPPLLHPGPFFSSDLALLLRKKK